MSHHSGKYDVSTHKLASELVRALTSLDPKSKTMNSLYNSLRRAVYGIPGVGEAVPIEDLVHCLAELLGKTDPSESEINPD